MFAKTKTTKFAEKWYESILYLLKYIKVDCRLYEPNYKLQQLCDVNRTLKREIQKIRQERDTAIKERDTISDLYQGT